MGYYKKTYLLLVFFVAIISGCSSDDGGSQLALVVTNFQPSYSQVALTWELTRPNNIIVQDLHIYRTEKNDAVEFSQTVEIANLPSNATTFTDNDVPYKSEVTYIVSINYTDNNQNQSYHTLDAAPQIFSRPFAKFDKVPLQVAKDPLQAGVYHVLLQTNPGELKRYDCNSEQVTNSASLATGAYLGSDFQFANNNEVFVADSEGKISKMNTDNYNILANYYVDITDDLNAFTVDGDRIYYQDDQVLKFYSMATGISTNTGRANTFSAIETISANTQLLLYADSGGSAAEILGFSPQNCGTTDCWPTMIQTMNGTFPASHSIDPHIFSWNPTKQKFISAFNGDVFNRSNLTHEVRLKDITGKRYLNFAYDSAGNLYATVQGEKIIQKFNANYELIDTIHTKLYPVYVMFKGNLLQVVGAYEPVEYWGYYYGYEFNFDIKCAVEILN